MAGQSWDRVPIDPQSVEAPLSRAAIFLTLTAADGPQALSRIRDTLGSLDDLLKTVGFRHLDGKLSCIAAIGSALWDRLEPARRPAQLRPFAPVVGAVHTAPATAGDLFFHIRAERVDLCFELSKLLLVTLGDGVRVVDEVSGFRYFDARDLLGFVDGTANPAGQDIPAAALVGDEDPDFAGGSYVVTQKYLHDMAGWTRLRADQQEQIIGRTKVDNIELDDAATGQKSHKTLATIVDEQGVEHEILRDNMPFGSAGRGEFGTYFIGYARQLWVIEKMLQRMFVGDPPGDHDRLLDFSTAHTGATFFAPSRAMLASLADGA
ncbi:Dyp-type peroxidase [Ancylobacter terrae]|uniref:Dyp-type peroxidase n=1 Tax=Ancylobacter sp. sgz301288 TaxID=3342077 RepID=UPI00385EE1AD